MRRVLFSLMAVGVGFFIVAVSAVSVGKTALVGQAGAVDEVKPASSEGSGEGEPAPAERSGKTMGIDYYLAYPGILPDHPFYFLKMIRDRVRLIFAGEGLDRARLLLLYADKRVGAALALVEGGRSDLGVTTALKAEQYMSQVVDELEGIDDEGMWKNVAMAGKKHDQVLVGMAERLEGDDLSRLEEARSLNGSVMGRIGEVVEVEIGTESGEGDSVSTDDEDEAKGSERESIEVGM